MTGIHITEEIRVECVRLRSEERLGGAEIARRVGISTPSVVGIVSGDPLTRVEKKKHRLAVLAKSRESLGRSGYYVGGDDWTTTEVRYLKGAWWDASQKDIQNALPWRSWNGIVKKASNLKLRRTRSASNKNPRKAHPIFVRLRAERERLGISRRDLADRIGYDVQTVSQWELGLANPRWEPLSAWLSSLGCELIVSQTKYNPIAKGGARNQKRAGIWSQDETELMKELVAQGTSNSELETILGRSQKDIAVHGQTLGMWKLTRSGEEIGEMVHGLRKLSG